MRGWFPRVGQRRVEREREKESALTFFLPKRKRCRRRQRERRLSIFTSNEFELKTHPLYHPTTTTSSHHSPFLSFARAPVLFPRSLSLFHFATALPSCLATLPPSVPRTTPITARHNYTVEAGARLRRSRVS